jgi:hypothetical protein
MVVELDTGVDSKRRKDSENGTVRDPFLMYGGKHRQRKLLKVKCIRDDHFIWQENLDRTFYSVIYHFFAGSHSASAVTYFKKCGSTLTCLCSFIYFWSYLSAGKPRSKVA